MVRVGILIWVTCRLVDTIIDYVLHVVPIIALNALMMGCRNIDDYYFLDIFLQITFNYFLVQ